MRDTQVITTSGLPRETLSRAKRNSTIASRTLTTLETIARALRVEVKDLFDEIRGVDTICCKAVLFYHFLDLAYRM